MDGCSIIVTIWSSDSFSCLYRLHLKGYISEVFKENFGLQRRIFDLQELEEFYEFSKS